MNAIRIKVTDEDLFNAIVLVKKREKEKFMQVLNELKKRPMKASEIEQLYGNSTAYTLIRRLINSGMLEKDGKYYKLSKKFSTILRAWAEEWDKFVEGE